MALDNTAAVAVATAIVGHLGIVGPAAVIAIPFWTSIVNDIFQGIVSHAEVVPLNINIPPAVPTPMMAGATPVTGKGGIS